MKIMYATNNPKYAYDQDTKIGWNLLPSLFTKQGAIVLGVGKYDLSKFYLKYLKFKPDIIVVEWPPSCFFIPFLRKIGLISVPVVFNWGDYYADMMENYPKSIVRFMENYAAKNTDHVISQSKFNQKKAQKYKNSVTYIPHGYFPDNIKTKIDLDKLKTKKKNVKVIYLGDQLKWKKVDQIIIAVKDTSSDLFLFGETNQEFVELVKKNNITNVHFMGYINSLEVKEVLNQADILVNTSNQDCSYKFFEYIRVGKPILAYDGLPKYLLEHKKTAYLTKNFKQGLIDLINSPELRKIIQKNVKKIKVFTWDQITYKYLKLFGKIIKENEHK